MLGRWQVQPGKNLWILTVNISEPCMRGHRSSKCTHEDRLLVQVRKPGRPLSKYPIIMMLPSRTILTLASRFMSAPPYRNWWYHDICGCKWSQIGRYNFNTCS